MPGRTEHPGRETRGMLQVLSGGATIGATAMAGRGFAGLLVVDLDVPGARSLKDKRSPLRSVTQRLRNAGISVSEVAHHDSHRRAQLAISVVAGGSGDCERRLDEALRVLESRPDLIVTVRQRTVLAVDEFE